MPFSNPSLTSHVYPHPPTPPATLSALLQAPATAQEEEAREGLLWSLVHRALAPPPSGGTGTSGLKPPGAAMGTLRGMPHPSQQGQGAEPEAEVGTLALVALTLRCMVLTSGREVGRPESRLREGELRALVDMVARAAARKREQEEKASPTPVPPPPPQQQQQQQGGTAVATTTAEGSVLQEARRSLLGALGLSFKSSKPAPAPAPAPASPPVPAAEGEKQDDDGSEDEEEDEEEEEMDDDLEDDAERPFPRKQRRRRKRRGAQPASLCCGQQVLSVASLAAWALQTHATLREAAGLLGVRVGKRLEPRAWFDGGLLAAALACPDHPERRQEAEAGAEAGAGAGSEAEAAEAATRLRRLLWEAVTEGVDLGACLAPASASAAAPTTALAPAAAEVKEQTLPQQRASQPVAIQQQQQQEEDLTSRLKRQLGLGLGLGMGGAAATAPATAAPLPRQEPDDEDDDEGDDVVLLSAASASSSRAAPAKPSAASLGLLTPPSLPQR